MSRASRNIYHPGGDPNNFKTVESALDSLDAAVNAAVSSFLSYLIPLTSPGADRILFWQNSSSSVTWLTASSGLSLSGTSLSVVEATSSEYRANTSGLKTLTPQTVWDSVGYVSLTDAATISVDMSAGFNFSVTISGNRTLGNPTNPKVGQSGCFAVTASGATRTLARSANYKSTSDISWPISIASGQTAYLFYCVISSSVILVTAVLNNPT